jgi:hypothetical protein
MRFRYTSFNHGINTTSLMIPALSELIASGDLKSGPPRVNFVNPLVIVGNAEQSSQKVVSVSPFSTISCSVEILWRLTRKIGERTKKLAASTGSIALSSKQIVIFLNRHPWIIDDAVGSEYKLHPQIPSAGSSPKRNPQALPSSSTPAFTSATVEMLF